MEDPEDFEERGARYLRQELPQQTSEFSDEDLRDRVVSCMLRCGEYGLESEEQILHFARVTLMLGEDFDAEPEHSWAIDVLRDPEMSADERAAMLAALAESLMERQEN